MNNLGSLPSGFDFLNFDVYQIIFYLFPAEWWLTGNAFTVQSTIQISIYGSQSLLSPEGGIKD